MQAPRVGVVDGAFGGEDRLFSIAALFPHVAFQSVGPVWPRQPPSGTDILIVPLDAAGSEVEAAMARLKAVPAAIKVVVILKNADVATTRRLAHGGAADILPAPVTEPALALCLERLLTNESSEHAPSRSTGEVVAVLKAGGGVGATALAAQMAAILGGRGEPVCLADLDLQFGAAALYLDLPEAVTVLDCLGAGSIEQTPFNTALARHRSGAQVLAAPHELTPLDALSPAQVEALVRALRAQFALTLIELPSVWTAWTNRALHMADRIVLVTHLSVPHVHMVKRQLRVLAGQGLGDRAVTLVCNSFSSDRSADVSLKTAERALGRPFDVVIPEDRSTMNAAINQGLEISAVRRGTKLEKALMALIDHVAPRVAIEKPGRGRR